MGEPVSTPNSATLPRLQQTPPPRAADGRFGLLATDLADGLLGSGAWLAALALWLSGQILRRPNLPSMASGGGLVVCCNKRDDNVLELGRTWDPIQGIIDVHGVPPMRISHAPPNSDTQISATRGNTWAKRACHAVDNKSAPYHHTNPRKRIGMARSRAGA